MKILSLTAGAASMYCGSCLRDNALAAELIAQGHDVILLPLYTPTLTDEANVSDDHVFFGGISVYLQQQSAIFRHTPRFVDKLWDSRFALKWASKSSIPTSPQMLGELTVSILRGEHGHHKKELRKLLDWLVHEPAPDIVNIPYTLLISLAGPIKEALKCPITCALQGEDLFLDGLEEPYRSQSIELIRTNLHHVDAFLPVSDYYAAHMSEYFGIPRDRMHVVPIGINLKGYENDFSFPSNCFTVGYFARIAPEKGLQTLCEAYRWLRKNTEFGGATLEAAGYLPHENRPYLESIQREMKDAGFESEFQYRGALDRHRKIDFLRSMTVLSVPSSYPDPKGIYLLEAMATGVPVVQPRHGAFPEVVEKTGGGLLFEPGRVESLAQTIYTLWKDRARTEALGRAGAAGVREHYSVQRMARRALQVYSNVAGIDSLAIRA